MATTTAETETAQVHFFIETFYGAPLGACMDAPFWSKGDKVDTTEGVTCPSCLEWLDQDGADD